MSAATPPPVTYEQLRAAGYTAAAKDFPLSEAGLRWLAAFNGIAPEQAPAAWWYAPNEAMRQMIERRGAS